MYTASRGFGPSAVRPPRMAEGRTTQEQLSRGGSRAPKDGFTARPKPRETVYPHYD